LVGFVTNGGSNVWNPESSFVGGTVTDSPDAVGDELALIGRGAVTNTVTFSTPVENPVFAIWSLGRPGFAASFSFGSTPTLQAGGPNSIYGGSSITVSGNVVSGFEGNGVVQFDGTVSSISWTNTPENYYSFTVGVNGAVPEPNPIPEPATALLTLSGAGLAFLYRRAKRT
jgi:hypothetical protein